MTIQAAALATAAALVLVGCSSGGKNEAPAPTPLRTTSTLGPEVTFQAVVAEVLASGRVLALDRPVSGFAAVALKADTEVVRPDGAKLAAGDIVRRATIEVTGSPADADRAPPGAVGTLLARRIVVL